MSWFQGMLDLHLFLWYFVLKSVSTRQRKTVMCLSPSLYSSRKCYLCVGGSKFKCRIRNQYRCSRSSPLRKSSSSIEPFTSKGDMRLSFLDAGFQWNCKDWVSSFPGSIYTNILHLHQLKSRFAATRVDMFYDRQKAGLHKIYASLVPINKNFHIFDGIGSFFCQFFKLRPEFLPASVKLS